MIVTIETAKNKDDTVKIHFGFPIEEPGLVWMEIAALERSQDGRRVDRLYYENVGEREGFALLRVRLCLKLQSMSYILDFIWEKLTRAVPHINQGLKRPPREQLHVRRSKYPEQITIHLLVYIFPAFRDQVELRKE